VHTFALTLRTSLAVHMIAAIFAGVALAQPTEVVLRGEVTDTSGGVLPGVSVTATAPDGQLLGKAVTDGGGRYEIKTLLPGVVKLTFELDAFETSSVSVTVQAGGESEIVERMKLARMTEEVVVVGKVPVPPPPPPPPYVPTPKPRPTVTPVPPPELESVCGPAKPGELALSFGKIRSHRHDYARGLYGKGDELVIDGGTENGITAGQNLVVRRYYRANSPAAEIPEMGEHTAGLVQIISTEERSSTAIVVYACNELMRGDLLEEFVPEVVRTPDPAGTPAYDDAARILFADDGQLFGAPRRLLVIDRGTEQGVRAGHRFTLFRRKTEGGKLMVVGEAAVISVRTTSATIRVLSATDAIEFGDFAAPHREVKPN
jgi:hypothetical protein